MADVAQSAQDRIESVGQTAESALADDDAALVVRVQQGEVSAFNQLVLRYRERLFSVVYNLTANREDATDLVQESFIKAFSSISRFKGSSSFFTWLYRIAVNTTLSHLKKTRRRRFFSLENIHEEASQADVLETLTARHQTDKPVLLRELQEKLNDALQALSEKHRLVVVLFEVQGLSHAEIAEIIGTSEGTVRSRLHYAKQQLQGLLKDYLDKW